MANDRASRPPTGSLFSPARASPKATGPNARLVSGANCSGCVELEKGTRWTRSRLERGSSKSSRRSSLRRNLSNESVANSRIAAISAAVMVSPTATKDIGCHLLRLRRSASAIIANHRLLAIASCAVGDRFSLANNYGLPPTLFNEGPTPLRRHHVRLLNVQ